MIINSSKHFALEAKAFTQGPQVQVFSYMNKIEYNNINDEPIYILCQKSIPRELIGERILKIDRHLPKLLSNIKRYSNFLRHSVEEVIIIKKQHCTTFNNTLLIMKNFILFLKEN